MVIRVFALLVSVVLLGFTPFLIYSMTVPSPRFRVGSYVDFVAFASTVVAIYGGVLLGVGVLWAKRGWDWQRLRPAEVFKAGVWGAGAVSLVFIGGAGVRSLAAQGSFEKGVGNLWGLVVIVALFLGALVSGGLALLLHGVRPSGVTGN